MFLYKCSVLSHYLTCQLLQQRVQWLSGGNNPFYTVRWLYSEPLSYYIQTIGNITS